MRRRGTQWVDAIRTAEDASDRRPPLRILHVYKDVFPSVVGGIEKQIDMIRRGMPDLISNVVVSARGPRTRVESSARLGLEARVAEFGPRWLSVPVSPTLPLWVARIPADVIHLHMPNPAGELAVLLAGNGRPIVASYHADIVRQARFERAYSPLVQACLRRSGAIVVGSRRLARSSPALQGHQSKLRLIRHSVDVERYRPGAVSERRRSELRARYGEPLVVAVGRLVYYKGFELLIEAARGLEGSVVIVGDGPEGPRLRALAAGLPNVHLTGELDEDELVAHLAAADCFAMCSTSRAESFGISVAEAQAMGLPAVVADTGSGTVEAVEHGFSGLVIAPGDVTALRQALVSLLSDAPRRQAMGEAARARAVANHAAGERMRELAELYAEVARSPRD